MYAEFDLAIPETLDGALGILADGNDWKTMPLAGGTNLIVDIRAKRARPARVVGLGNIDELRGLGVDDERISIGARTTVSDLLVERL